VVFDEEQAEGDSTKVYTNPAMQQIPCSHGCFYGALFQMVYYRNSEMKSSVTL